MQKLVVPIKISKQFIALMLAFLGMSVGAILYLPLSFWAKILLLIFYFFYAGLILRRDVFLLQKDSVREISFVDEVLSVNGMPAVLLGDSTVTTWLAVLRVSNAVTRKKNTVVIFRDAMRKDQYRQLLVRVRWITALRSSQ